MLNIEAEAQSRVDTDDSDDIIADSITLLAGGGYVVTWSSGILIPGAAGEIGASWFDVHAQIYDAAGQRVGGEFRVNTTTLHDQQYSRGVALGDGGFVVIWNSIIYDPDTVDTFEFTVVSQTLVAQRYDSAGNPVNLLGNPEGGTGEVVLSESAQEQTLATAEDGSFLLAWVTSTFDGDGIQLTYVDSDGDIAASTLHLTGGPAVDPEVAFIENGAVLVYSVQKIDGSGRASFDVFAQRFDTDGAKVGNAVQVNTYNVRHQVEAAVTASETGGYVIIWQSRDQDGSLYGIYGQVFDAVGQKSGAEFRINTYTTSSQILPQISALDNGYFAVAWMSEGQDGDGYGVYLQIIDGAGNLVGGEIRIADETIGDQSSPKITTDGETVYVIWTSKDGEGNETLLTRQFHVTVPMPDNNANDLAGGAGADTIDGLGGNDTIHGLGGDDALSGGSGVDALYGDDGNDWLDGGSFVDSCHGGLGDDTFVVNSANETVVELAGEGTDTVRTVVSLTLAANVENLTLSGSANLSGKGNGLNNVLTGNAGNNILSGGLGDDTYYIQNAGDSVEEKHGEGKDTIYSTISYSLFGRAVETLTLTGSGHLNATGNSLNNTLTGTSGNNVLDGGTGADKMIGGLGDDTYYVDHVQDNVTELHLQGTDTVISSVSYSLFGRAVETLTLTGSGNLNGIGNSLANVLTGNAGANTLDGGTGKDVLTGGLGADIFLFGTASGKDTVTDFNAGQDDSINIHAHTGGVANAGIVVQNGADTVINLGGGNLITVQNASQADVLAHIIW